MREIDNKVIELHESGVKAPEIAKMVGRNTSNVYRIIKRIKGKNVGEPRTDTKISSEEALKIRADFITGYSKSELKNRYKHSSETINFILGTLPEELKQSSVLKAADPKTQGKSPDSYQAAVEKWRLFVGDTDPKPIKVPESKKSNTRKILILSDLHIPFHNEANLTKAINDNLDADICILAGDLIDSYSLSKFPKYGSGPTIKEEFQSAKVILEQICSLFPKVIVHRGNHENRLHKTIGTKLPADLVSCVRILGIDELLGLNCPNLEISSINVSGNEVNHITVLGDLVCGHPEFAGGAALGGVSKFVPWLINWSSVLGIKIPKVVIMGHTHGMSAGFMDLGILGMESGCLCDTLGYTLEPGAKYKRPSTNGYVTLEQENVNGEWQCIINSCRFFKL